MAKNIINNNTLNFKALHTENKTHDDLVAEGLREELTRKETPRRLKDSRVLKMVSDDLPIKENKKEKKFINSLHFYEGEDAIIEEEVCVPFIEFVDCLASLGWVYSNYQTVHKDGKSYTRYTLIPDGKNCASEDELKDILTELYHGKVDFGEATYTYARELSYLTVIIPDDCEGEMEEATQSRDTMLRENALYKRGKRIQEQNLRKFCEDNLPAGKTMFYIVKNAEGKYLVNDGTKETPNYWFKRTVEDNAEAFESMEEAEDAIRSYAFDCAYPMDWADYYDEDERVTEPDGTVHPDYAIIDRDCDKFLKECDIIPIGTRKVKESIKKYNQKKLKESSVGDRKRDVAFFLVKNEDGEYLCKDGNNYYLDTDINNAEAYELQDDAEDDIYLYNVNKEEEMEFKIVNVYINDLYVKEYGVTGNLKI